MAWLIDGPIGTMLEARGIPTPAPLWSAAALQTHPEAILRLHREYAEAGADIHTAATFRTSPAAAGDRAASLTAQAVGLARRAARPGQRVAASLAPVLDCWRPDISPPDAATLHAHTAELLAAARPDLILVETFAHVGEAEAAVTAAVGTGLEVWASLSPGFNADLLPPAQLADGARRLAGRGASHVLVNCLPARRSQPWVEALAATGLPWGVYANAGPPSDRLRWRQRGAAAAWTDLASGWLDLGASIIGGCCGAGPSHIGALRGLLDHRGLSSRKSQSD